MAGASLMVQLGSVMAGATPFKAGNINETFRGSVYVAGRLHTAIIKDLDPKELANEVMTAAIGLSIGLPVPPPVLAYARQDRLVARKGPEINGGRLVFASVDVSQPQVATLYSGGGGRRVLERLAKWPDLGRLYGFDTFVANIDRHAGNVLFSGDREVWLIDHGWCFTGPSWTPTDLSIPDQQSACRLNEWLTPLLDGQMRAQKASEAATVEMRAAKLDLREAAEINHMAELLSIADLEALINFLSRRVRHVPRLAASALGINLAV